MDPVVIFFIIAITTIVFLNLAILFTLISINSAISSLLCRARCCQMLRR